MKPSPISNLNDDTLLSIFDIITSQMAQVFSLQKDRPLIAVHKASQVCRQWRVLLLATPWIWGRLMDLNGFSGPRAIEGLEEVSNRAGSASLWIHGTVTMQGEEFQLFIRLLGLWERIERFVVDIHATRDNPVPHDVQTRFLSAAPRLKMFDVRFWFTDHILLLETLQPSSLQSLFANHAPCLQTIRTDKVAYRPDSPWLSNVRAIVVPKNFNLNDIFTLLQQTPVIEALSLDSEDLIWEPMPHPLHELDLPRLSSIKIDSNLPAIARMLDHISPGSLSTFSLTIDDHQTAELNDLSILSSLEENVAQYVTNYFTANQSKVVMFHIMKNELRFRDVTNVMGRFDHAAFEIITRSSVIEDWEIIIICLLNSFVASLGANPSIMNSVTQLRLPRLEVELHGIPKLYSFLSSFRHIREIETREEYGCTLCKLSNLNNADGDPRHILFPELHTLRLSSTAAFVTGGGICDDITEYLTRRKTLGFPVAKLDLTNCTESNYTKDLSDLEKVDGLEVVCSKPKNGSGEGDEVCSYICGTGKPEQLRRLTRRY